MCYMFWSLSLLPPPPPAPHQIHNKIFSDQHWRYVQKYDHLDARFITVTYHIKAFLLFAIDSFSILRSHKQRHINLERARPFQSKKTQVVISPMHISRKKGPRQIVYNITNASWDHLHGIHFEEHLKTIWISTHVPYLPTDRPHFFPKKWDRN